MLHKSLFTSGKDDWETPQSLFDELHKEFEFVLDVCANSQNRKCDNYFTKNDDSLTKDWGSFGWKWMNPPYGRKVTSWIKKAYDSGKVVALLPARTDTIWFHKYIYNNPKAEIRFLQGRLQFSGNKWNAPFPNMIVIFR